MKLGMALHPEKWTDEHLRMARQLGCETVIAWVPLGAGDGVWHKEDLARLVRQAESHGLILEGIENFHPQHIDHVVLDEPGKEEQMENLIKTVENAGEVGIKLFGYNFSCCGVQGYYAERGNAEGRGAASIKMFDEEKVDHSPLPSRRFWFNTEIERRSAVDVLPPTDAETHWSRLKYFLENLCPVAEKYGMKLCAHPDDPPIEFLKGTFRPLTSIEGMRKLINLVDSPANALEFCQGTISTMRDINVYEVIEEFASKGKIGYVHFRNTSGRLPRYSEVFIDNGYVDMPKALEIYKRCGFDGTVVPDHTPRLEAKDWWETGMSFALGYIRGIMQSKNL